ncbi:PREDICTED: uncharacterized protein LOC104592349 [Nelumbo nucifera]|uniref:Uncharacterized protein n=2 Tax=Nelumbo nucifera TaxID=4432 RepID=A0A822ZSL3_NELNU|nr:PREDICTED: uncharacterized protein LOC104592349 [Nelumbo nucifera]DAD44838.1 TPA_asm: hypothetical protein HUJ06_003068 [Nelumbo nucifera]
MATTLLSFRPTGIQACASSPQRKPDPNRRKASSSNWWAPLFDWAADPDYIDDNNNSSGNSDVSADTNNRSETGSEIARPRSRFAPGCLTEEKARQLRIKTMENANFHDIMYHSAIASRLASDIPSRSDR